jgi:hypothetical protein
MLEKNIYKKRKYVYNGIALINKNTYRQLFGYRYYLIERLGGKMEYLVKEGNYNELGAIINGTEVVFTFRGERRIPAI